MERLALQLCALMQKPLDDNPFTPEQILVQSPGMSQWLKLFIAEHLDVMANVEFPLPSSFIWSLYEQLIPDLPEDSAFTKAHMCWKLLGLLPQHLEQDEFTSLKQYLADDEDGLKAYQLCEKIADVFDQYLMYRPDWISTWQQGKDEIKDTDVSLQPWQPILWRSLVTFTESIGQSGYHRANLHDVLLEKMPQFLNQQQQLTLPSRLFIFGISALPQQQLHIFELLSEFIDIHLMLFNPCQLYWGDIVDEKMQARIKMKYKQDALQSSEYTMVGNPLLASWGKLGRDYLEQLLLTNADSLEDFVEPCDSEKTQNLLGLIQSDIFNLSYRESMEPLTAAQMLTEQGKRLIKADDNSLDFHACHSPLREVEVLHDKLLHLFANNKDITPKDVIVMMPDVSLYSPYIAAVFNSHNRSTNIPFAISDKGFSLENPIVISFLQLMDLPQSRFSASELLDLLAVPAIIHGMGLVPDDIDVLHHWVDEVGIRWGIDANHKHELELPADDLNTWHFGLQRLLLGYALNDEQLVDGILPYTDVEGQNADTLGKLVHFIELLQKYRGFLAKDGTLEQKCALVGELLTELYLPDEQENTAIVTIREVLKELEQQQRLGNCQNEISQRVFAYQLAQKLNDKTASQRFLAGQVNFCTLLPMRSIPFKVICLLGLNDGDYPRFTAPIGFDLMAAGTARKGDRSRRLDDRYLLLEAILSAREYLHISYVGRSMQDNSPKVPSILVSELLEYCQQGFRFDKQHQLHIEHPLQPFNPKYFEPDSSLTSFNAHWYRYVSNRDVKQKQSEQQSIAPINDAKPQGGEIDIAELLKFMSHPVKFFFNRTLQLHFDQLQQFHGDDETFSLDGLSRYQILDKLTTHMLQQGLPLEHSAIDASGILPHSEVGELAFNDVNQLATSFVEQLEQTSLHFLPPVEINLSLGDFRLLGWVKQLTSDGLLFYRPSTIKAKDKLTAWFYHLCVSAMGVKVGGKKVKTKYIGLSEQITFKAIEADEAKAMLAQYLDWYSQGLQQPLAFFINTSEKWASTNKDSEVNKAFLGDSFRKIPGEGADAYISRVFTDVNALPKSFYEIAEACFTPLNEAISEGGE